MASALRQSGSTYRWRKIRLAYQRELERLGSAPCWRCGELVRFGEPWALGHIVDRAMGGDDSQLAYEHLNCSRRSGAELSAMLTRARHDPRVWSDTDELYPGDDERLARARSTPT